MNQDLESRLRNLERLLEKVSSPTPSVPTGSVDLVAVTRLRALAPRLRLLTAEISERQDSANWDTADAICARLLLSDLTEAIHIYRTAASALDTRLTRAATAVGTASGLVEDQLPRKPDSNRK